MSMSVRLVERHLTTQIEDAIGDFRVVIVNGPRQSGKTTLLRTLHASHGGSYRSLDVEPDHTAIADDPLGFARHTSRPVFVDEVQRGGDALVRSIKVAVDEDPRPGSFVLSGSSRFLTVPTLTESLAGRAIISDLWPLSVAERAGHQPDLVDLLFTDPASLLAGTRSQYTRAEYIELVCASGFPEALKSRSRRGRSNWFRSYVNMIIQRDVRDLARIHYADALPRLLGVLAARTAQVANLAEVARTMDMDPNTLRSYLPLLDAVYLVIRLPAWSRNLTAKAVRAPKLHLADSGLAGYLTGRGPRSLMSASATSAGALLETFVISELTRQATVSEIEMSMFHFRDRGGAEVDCVLEARDGRVAALEVKLAASVNAADLQHLRMFRDRLGSDLVAGVLFYTGEHALSFGEGIIALPISRLWGNVPYLDLALVDSSATKAVTIEPGTAGQRPG